MSVGLQLGFHTNAGCSLLEVYQARFQMAEHAVHAVFATLPPTISNYPMHFNALRGLTQHDCILYPPQHL